MEPVLKEKSIFRVFEISVILKGLNALTEIIGGILIFLLDKADIVRFFLKITQNELSDDPKDFIANLIVNSIASFSVNSQVFFSVYLLIHGILKIFLVIGLLKRKLWAYPSSIVIFGLFIAYQIYRYNFTHSGWLLALTIFDIFIVILVWHEYRIIKRTIKQ
jgi:uncharacterized membrane protein